MIGGIIIGFLISILIVTTQIYLNKNKEFVVKKLKKVKKGAIIKLKPKINNIIKHNDEKGLDTPLDEIL